MKKLISAYITYLDTDNKSAPFTFTMHIAKYEKVKGEIFSNKVFKDHTIERDFSTNTVKISL